MSDTDTIVSADEAPQCPRPGHVLVMRSCDPEGRSHRGFQWPLEVGATAEAPDWSPIEECGYGLHGCLWGAGDPTSAWHWEEGARWLVVEVLESELVSLGGKVKFPRCTIVHVGDRDSAPRFMADHAPANVGIIGGTATAGDSGTATAGDSGTATAGDGGTATAGDSGTATAGVRGTATAGYGGTATAGDSGTATAGDSGTATAGVRGTATAGVRGTATAGVRGTATAGVRGTATAGERGTIIIAYYDYEQSRYRRLIGEVGIDGIEANVPYVIRDGRLVRK